MARNPADPRGESAGIKSLPPCGERKYVFSNRRLERNLGCWIGSFRRRSVHKGRLSTAALASGKKLGPSSMSCGSTPTRKSRGRALCLHVWASVSDDLRQDG